jgi:hypothetical protein
VREKNVNPPSVEDNNILWPTSRWLGKYISTAPFLIFHYWDMLTYTGFESELLQILARVQATRQSTIEKFHIIAIS